MKNFIEVTSSGGQAEFLININHIGYIYSSGAGTEIVLASLTDVSGGSTRRSVSEDYATVCRLIREAQD